MRGSLSGVRARVDRLAARLHLSAQTGCSACRGKEDIPCVLCYYGSAVPDIPEESRCEACGRVVPYRYVLVGYDINMKPTDME
jgi:hypothetical protein